MTAHVVNTDRCNVGNNVLFQEFTFIGGGTGFSCPTAGCGVDLNANCPIELEVNNGNTTVGCMSSCQAHNNRAFCCDTPSDACKHSPSAIYFKNNCPEACSNSLDSDCLNSCGEDNLGLVLG
jgi:hypothetical protein